MSIQLPLLLASAGGLLPEPNGTIAGAVPLGDSHALLMLLAMAPSMVMLVILLYERCDSRRHSEFRAGRSTAPASIEPARCNLIQGMGMGKVNGHDVTCSTHPGSVDESARRTAYGSPTEGIEQHANMSADKIKSPQYPDNTSEVHI